jgi:hypothetical protein
MQWLDEPTATVNLTQYSNSQGGSMQIQMANQQQIGQPKLGSKKFVSDTIINQSRGFDKTTWKIGVLVWPKTVCNHHYNNVARVWLLA